MIHHFKYERQIDLARPLAQILAEKIDYQYDLIIPIPIHRRRLRQRGYNQSALLTKRLAKLTGFRCDCTSLVRQIDSVPQVGLSGRGRLENVKGAFSVTKRHAFEGLDVLIVDDVMTTGATANESARIIMKSGACRIDVLTLARTV